MRATSRTSVERRTAHKGLRAAGLGETAALDVVPRLNNQAQQRTKEPARQKGPGATGQATEHAPGQTVVVRSSAEQKALSVRIKAGDQGAREALILANLWLVAKIAKRYYSVGASLDDLIQEGSRGLIHAVDHYDPKAHNTRFSAYAAYWIRNKIQRAVAANFSLVRLPEYMFRMNVRAHQLGVKPQIDNGFAPDDPGPAALESRLKISRRQRRLLKHAMISRSPYYDVDDVGDEINLVETLTSNDHTENDLEKAEKLEKLHEALEQLTPVEAWLIRRRFGLDDPHERSSRAAPLANEVARASVGSRAWTSTRMSLALGISLRRLRKVERVAMEKLRQTLRCSCS
jgi:RNA polymerase sigma factor (sigma-70 family)